MAKKNNLNFPNPIITNSNSMRSRSSKLFIVVFRTRSPWLGASLVAQLVRA